MDCYIRVNDEIVGPLSESALIELAEEGRVTEETVVLLRSGGAERQVAAKKLKGLREHFDSPNVCKWFIKQQGKTSQLLTTDALRRAASRGMVTPDTLVRRWGRDWTKARDVGVLCGYLDSATESIADSGQFENSPALNDDDVLAILGDGPQPFAEAALPMAEVDSDFDQRALALETGNKKRMAVWQRQLICLGVPIAAMPIGCSVIKSVMSSQQDAEGLSFLWATICVGLALFLWADAFFRPQRPSGAIYRMRGVGAVLDVFENKIEITPFGLLGLLTKGLKGTKSISFFSLSAIQFKKSGVTNGYLQFTVPGGIENTRGLFGARSDENSFMFSSQSDLAAKIKDYIENRIHELRVPSPALPSTSSMADEIEKLAEMKAKGILSDDEFQAAKHRLIHRQ